MKSKLKIITLAFVLLTIVLVPSCFAATVLEGTTDYTEGAIIYGSTRFDMDQIITAGVAFNAGINESKVWVALGNKLNELEPVTPYYYDGATWYEITSDSAEEIEDEDEVKKIEENLHIFFVNNEVKTVEVPFDGKVDEGSVTDGVKYNSTDKKFTVPAYVFEFEFTTGGAEIEVKTNIDTNIKEGNTEEVKIPEIIDNNIASIGTVFYTDIHAAIEAAKAGETVKVLQDIELSKQLVITKAVTLDFNGKVVTVAEDLEDISAILVLEGGDLVITGNGTLNAASQGNNYSIAVWAKETGKATIKNGTFTNVGAKSKTETGANNNEMIYVSGSGVITIEGGTFVGNTENETWGTRYTLNSHDTSYTAGTANIVVKGGTFTKFNPADNLAEGEGTNFVAEGYKVVVDGEKYTVVAYDANNIADEADLRYFMAKGGTVKLAADIKLETNKTIGLDKDVVLDLNGHTISVFEGYTKNNIIWTSAKLTVTGNGTIDARMTDNTYTYALYAWNGGNITIENGNFIGIYGLEDYVTALIYCQGEGSLITILDGTFVGDGVFTLNVSDAHYTAGTANIVVKGGTFTGFNPANNEAEGPNTNFVAEGYKVVVDGDKYTVVAE